MPDSSDDLFSSLRSLAEASFPRRCKNCGREYLNAEEFIAATRQIRFDRSGLKQSEDDDGNLIVELFRNCACGSTMLENFYNRRDLSEAGKMRRARFDDLLSKLIRAGVPPEAARTELLKLVRGQEHELVALIKSFKDI